MRIVRSIAIWLLRLYQASLGPFLGGRCRFYPSCSNYAVEAFTIHPPARATWLTARRLCRCHPLGGHGVDPVPEARKSQIAKSQTTKEARNSPAV